MATRVGTILESAGSAALPGVYDALSAKIAEHVGFPMAFVSGYAVSATMIGEPDLGLLTQTEMLEAARRICGSVGIPILVDADTGYGNPLNVHRTVSELIAAGAAGCFLEDQVWPKRCGHLRGKRVVDREAYLNKIRAAADARGDHDFFIVARTDALAVLGIDEAVHRIRAACEAGADGGFVEAPETLQDLETIGRCTPPPRVANMIRGGRTPVLPREQLAELGFHLILHPLIGLHAAARTIQSLYEQLRDDGSIEGGESRLMSFEDFNRLIGVDAQHSLAERFGVDDG